MIISWEPFENNRTHYGYVRFYNPGYPMWDVHATFPKVGRGYQTRAYPEPHISIYRIVFGRANQRQRGYYELILIDDNILQGSPGTLIYINRYIAMSVDDYNAYLIAITAQYKLLHPLASFARVIAPVQAVPKSKTEAPSEWPAPGKE